MSSARTSPKFVLPTYARDPGGRAAVRGRIVALASVGVGCLIYGAIFAFFAPYLLVLMAAPIVVLASLVIWAMPESRTAPVATLEALFFLFLIVLVAWPNYIGVALPRLPWITAVRITSTPLCLVLLVCLSTSSETNTALARGFANLPVLTGLLTVFIAMQAASIALSHNISGSIDRFIVAQTTWTPMCLIGCYVFQKSGRVEKWAATLWGLGIFTGVIGLLEYRLHRVLWAGHLPKILSIQDPLVLQQFYLHNRASTEIYRVSSTFGTSLDFAEYISFVFPFLFHFMIERFSIKIRILAGISVPFFVVVAYITGARSGMVGFAVSCVCYLVILGVTLRRRFPKGYWGPLILFVAPAIAAGAVVGTLLIGRVRKLIIGGGAQMGSTLARVDQYKMGIPKVISHPFGYGIGQGGITLGYVDGGGLLTIDTYYLLIALEYGILGFVIYFGMVAYAIYVMGKTFLEGSIDDRELSFAAPCAVALLNFFIIRSVFSQQNNIPIVYMMFGMVFALALRSRRDGASETVVRHVSEDVPQRLAVR